MPKSAAPKIDRRRTAAPRTPFSGGPTPLNVYWTAPDREMIRRAVEAVGERAGAPVAVSAWALARLRAAAQEELGRG